jgi:hypothetical protein
MAKTKAKFKIGQNVLFVNFFSSDRTDWLKPGKTICKIVKIELDTSYDPPINVYCLEFIVKEVDRWNPNSEEEEFIRDWWVLEESIMEVDKEFIKLKTDAEKHKYFICKKIKDMYQRRKDQGYAF